MNQKREDIGDEDYQKIINVFERLSPNKAWSKVKQEDFTIRRFKSGFVNEIACCELTEDAIKRLIKNDREPKSIVVKFYPEDFFFVMAIWEKGTINQLISDKNLSPKLYFLDDKCMIHEYVKSQNYTYNDDLDTETVKQLACVLAKFHYIEAPISNVEFNKWNKLMDTFEDQTGELKLLQDKKFLKAIEEDEDKSIKEKYYSALEDFNLKELENFIKKIRTLHESPLVFSHSDFNRGNRIVSKHIDDNGIEHKQIHLVDFDYSTTNHRGADLGRYFSNYKHVEDNFGNEPFPNDEEMKIFLNAYRDECAKINGDWYINDPINDVEHMIKESKINALIGIFIDYYFCLLMYCRDFTGPKKIYFLDGAKNRFTMFKTLVKQCKKEGLIPEELTW